MSLGPRVIILRVGRRSSVVARQRSAMRMSLVDVFQSDLSLPSRVCIVAPGPRGFGHYRRIPKCVCVIAVGKAVMIPGVRADVWMMSHAHQGWFETANRSFSGLRVFGDVALKDRPEVADLPDCYGFKPIEPVLDPDEVLPIDGVIRCGGTTLGCAVQLAYNFGAEEILLCGADLSGDRYWDGTCNVQPQGHGTTWPAVARLNPLLRWMMHDRGIRIAALSPTRLDVPAYVAADGTAALTQHGRIS